MDASEEFVENATLDATTTRRNEILVELEKRRLARTLVVPTDDTEVKLSLRKRGLAICLFGEDAHDRRERLRGLLAEEVINSGEDGGGVERGSEVEEGNGNGDGERGKVEEEFYTEGSEDLKSLRVGIAKGSLIHSALRLRREKLQRGVGSEGDEYRGILRKAEHETIAKVADIGLMGTSSACARPLTTIANNGSCVVTGGMDGSVAVWSLPRCRMIQDIPLHEARVSKIRFDSNGERLISCSSDKSVKILMRGPEDHFQDVVSRTEHTSRVADAHLHPWYTDLFAAASYDGTFTLNTIEKGLALSQYTGHKSGVHSMTFDEDGGLLVTGGMEGGIRLWDLRSGRCVLTFQGAHADSVLSLAFRGGGGRLLVSGSSDHSCKVWDLRRMRPSWTIPAHKSVVSSISFLTSDDYRDVGGLGLITSGYDAEVKVWAARRGWAFVKGWKCEARVMDVAAGKYGIVGAGWDRKWRWWGHDKEDMDVDI